MYGLSVEMEGGREECLDGALVYVMRLCVSSGGELRRDTEEGGAGGGVRDWGLGVRWGG